VVLNGIPERKKCVYVLIVNQLTGIGRREKNSNNEKEKCYGN